VVNEISPMMPSEAISRMMPENVARRFRNFSSLLYNASRD
jgi:hypothetical protein